MWISKLNKKAGAQYTSQRKCNQQKIIPFQQAGIMADNKWIKTTYNDSAQYRNM